MDSRERTKKRADSTGVKLAAVTRLYSLTELEEVLGVTHRTLQSYIKAGRLKGVKIGGKWKVSEENLRAFVNSQ